MFAVKNMKSVGTLGFVLRDGSQAWLDAQAAARLDLAQRDGRIMKAWEKSGMVSIGELADEDLTDDERAMIEANDKLVAARQANAGNRFVERPFPEQATVGETKEARIARLREEADRLEAEGEGEGGDGVQELNPPASKTKKTRARG